MSNIETQNAVTPAGSATGGRHHVTVLFSDFCSSSRLANSVEPEINETILEEVIATAVAVIVKHGGVVNQCHGDGVLAVFGFPKIQEDDVRRATEAALELHRSVGELDFSALDIPAWFVPRMHSGVHSGLVVIGGGDWIQGQYKVTGPAANTASALSHAAVEDEVIVSASTLQGVLPFFEIRTHSPLPLKGLPGETPAYHVLGRSRVSTRFEARALRGLTAFFGRQRELVELDRALAEATAGNPAEITILGGAGLGKTRLIEEFLRRQRANCCVHRGYCESYGDVAPMQPFLQILRSVTGVAKKLSPAEVKTVATKSLAQLDPELANHTRVLLGLLGVRDDRPGAASGQTVLPVIDALGALFSAIARQQPLLLILDDWQWADDASRQILSGIRLAMSRLPALIVVATREVDKLDPGGQSSHLLRLVPLNPLESRRAVRALLPHCSDSDRDRICQQSGGNALFIEELCDSPLRLVAQRTGASSSVIPDWLFGLISARLDRLPREHAHVVRTAAVIGNVVPAWLLREVGGHQRQDAIVRDLAGADILASGEAPGTLRFKHGLTRDAVYELVGHREKRSLHLQIASALDRWGGPSRRREHHEALAYHYSGGGDNLRAYHHARCAGEKAMAASSLNRAREQFMAALVALDKLPPSSRMHRRWIELSLQWALPSVYGPAADQLYILERAASYAREANDEAGFAHVLYWLGYIKYVLGEQTAAVEYLHQALDVAEALGSKRLATQIQATLGQSLAAASRYGEAMVHLDSAIALKGSRASTAHLPVGTVFTMSCKAVALADQGDFSRAQDCLDWALDAAGGTGHEIESSSLNMRGAVFLWQGRWREVLDGAERSQAVAARVYAPYPLAMAHALEAYAGWMLEGDPARIAALQRVSEWLDEHNQRLFLSFTHGWLADAFAAAENFDDAAHFGNLGLLRAAQQDRVGEAMACRALAKVAAHRPDLVALGEQEYFDLALKSAAERGSPHEEAVTRLHRARRWAVAGRSGEALRELTLATDAFERMAMHWHQDQARQLAAQLN